MPRERPHGTDGTASGGEYGPFESIDLPTESIAFTVKVARVDWPAPGEEVLSYRIEARRSEGDEWQEIHAATLAGGPIFNKYTNDWVVESGGVVTFKRFDEERQAWIGPTLQRLRLSFTALVELTTGMRLEVDP